MSLREANRAWSQIFNEGLVVHLGDGYAYAHPEVPPSELTPFFPAERYLQALPASEQFTLRQVLEWQSNSALSDDQRVARYPQQLPRPLPVRSP